VDVSFRTDISQLLTLSQTAFLTTSTRASIIFLIKFKPEKSEFSTPKTALSLVLFIPFSLSFFPLVGVSALTPLGVRTPYSTLLPFLVNIFSGNA